MLSSLLVYIQQSLAEKVQMMLLRGDDCDNAVLIAFKEVEIAVRNAGGYPNTLYGKDLMLKAFNPDSGPLRDPTLVPAEREAMMLLFAGAIGHAKNPAGHRAVPFNKNDAVRLTAFASYLLSVVEQRVTAVRLAEAMQALQARVQGLKRKEP